MRRIAICLLGLTLTIGLAGCAAEDATDDAAPAETPATGTEGGATETPTTEP
jgi:hypothetical protein